MPAMVCFCEPAETATAAAMPKISDSSIAFTERGPVIVSAFSFISAVMSLLITFTAIVPLFAVFCPAPPVEPPLESLPKEAETEAVTLKISAKDSA